LRASIYPKDQWELALKNEKTDETRLKGIELGYTLCHPAGCTAEVEATDELLDDLRTSGGLVVSATNSAGAPVAFPVPLVGFAEAFAGPPVEAGAREVSDRAHWVGRTRLATHWRVEKMTRECYAQRAGASAM